MPFPGKIENFHMPGGGVRSISCMRAILPTNYDSMIGKIIVHAKIGQEQ